MNSDKNVKKVNEGLKYLRGNKTNVKPVTITQKEKPIPSGTKKTKRQFTISVSVNVNEKVSHCAHKKVSQFNSLSGFVDGRNFHSYLERWNGTLSGQQGPQPECRWRTSPSSWKILDSS